MKNENRTYALAQSVKEMLYDPFNILSDVKVVSDNMIQVRVVENHAEYVKKLLEVNYCESLVLLMTATVDEVTTLTYNC